MSKLKTTAKNSKLREDSTPDLIALTRGVGGGINKVVSNTSRRLRDEHLATSFKLFHDIKCLSKEYKKA